MDPAATAATSIAPGPAGSSPAKANGDRVLSPHIRNQHSRVVRGREFPVNAAIINADIARRQQRLSTLMRALQLAKGRGVQSIPPARAVDEETPQLDFFVELRRASEARGLAVLEERLAEYARLTPLQAAHLAMARVRVHIAKHHADSSGRIEAQTHHRSLADDLRRLEEILFAEALLKVPAEDIEAIRDLCARRYLARRHPLPPREGACAASVDEVDEPHSPSGSEADPRRNDQERFRV